MTLYLFGSGAYFAFLLFSKFSDRDCSKTNLASWIVIVIASVFWIVVIPISLIELRSKARAKMRLKQTEKSINSEVNSQEIESVEQKVDSDTPV